MQAQYYSIRHTNNMPSPTTSLSSLAINEDCHLCSKSTREESVCCDGCDMWTHYSCANLTEQEVNIIINYYCDDCEEKGSLTNWRKVRGTISQRITKDREYYEVEGFVDHREVDGDRQFLVKWKNEDGNGHPYTTTWEPEKYLDGALDLLQRYCREQQITLSKVTGLLGADIGAGQELSKDNWVPMASILSKLQTLRSNIRSDIQAKEWTEIED